MFLSRSNRIEAEKEELASRLTSGADGPHGERPMLTVAIHDVARRYVRSLLNQAGKTTQRARNDEIRLLKFLETTLNKIGALVPTSPQCSQGEALRDRIEVRRKDNSASVYGHLLASNGAVFDRFVFQLTDGSRVMFRSFIRQREECYLTIQGRMSGEDCIPS